MAEGLRFNDSNIYRSVCITTNTEIFTHFRSVYSSCMNPHSCQNNIDERLIDSILRNTSDAIEMYSEMTSLFPWYYFIITIADSIEYDNATCHAIVQSATRERELTRFVLWFPYTYYGRYTSTVINFWMKITECKQFISNIDLSLDNQCHYSNTKLISVKGQFSNKETLNPPCVPCYYTMSISVPLISEEEANYAYVGGIISGIVIVVGIVVLFIYIFKRKKNGDKANMKTKLDVRYFP